MPVYRVTLKGYVVAQSKKEARVVLQRGISSTSTVAILSKSVTGNALSRPPTSAR